jgi:hypothetical protein
VIIGIGYKHQVGKSYAAAMLAREYGFEELSFAAPVYRIAFVLADLDPALSADESNRERFKTTSYDILWPGCSGVQSGEPPVSHLTGREILEWVGTTIARTAVPDLWVSYFVGRYGARDQKDTHFVVPDVRFLTESPAVDLRVRVERPSQSWREPLISEAQGGSIDWDYEVVNDDTESYLDWWRNLMAELGIRRVDNGAEG